jgi:multicomponent Na+:H+ antiporter subunit D
VIEVACFRAPSKAAKRASDPPLNMLLPILALAAATIYFGIFTELPAGVATRAAQALIGGLK